jgi:hypothetical protein
VIITDFSTNVQINEQEYIKLKFNQQTINKIIHSLNNSHNNTGLFAFTASIKINSNDIDILHNNIYIKKIIKKPTSNSGFWIRYNIVLNKNDKNLYQIISPFFKKFNIDENTRIIGINFGSDPDSEIRNLYNALFSIREVEQYRKITDQYMYPKKDDWNSGKGWSPYHDWVERNVPGLDGLFREWRITPGILFQNNEKLGYLTFHNFFNELFHELYRKSITMQNIDIFEYVFDNLLYSFKIYKDVMIKGVDNSNVISFLNCFQHRKNHIECDDPDVEEICFDPDEKYMIPINQDILTEIICDFLDKHQDHFRNIPDWMFGDEFYRKVYDYMMTSQILPSSLDIQNIINDEKSYKKIINLVEKNFLEFLNTWITKHPQIRNKNTRELIIRDILLKDVIDENQTKNIFIPENISNIKNVDIIWRCYGNDSTGIKLQTENEVYEFRTGMNSHKMKLILNIIQNWWRKNWKNKELLSDEFFLVNKLRDDNGNDSLSPQRKDFDLIVVDNLLITLNENHKKCYLIKLIDKNDNILYSILIDKPTSGILSHAKDIRTGFINKYKLALLAHPGMRVHLRGTIKKVYTDTTYFVPNYRLNRISSIQITSGV